MDLLAVAGDALWILAMSLIASGARQFWRRLPEAVSVPMQWSLKRRPVWRAAKPTAFFIAVALPLAFGLILSAAARDAALTPDERLLHFLVRALTAPLFVLIHYAWMRAATATLQAEGALKP